MELSERMCEMCVPMTLCTLQHSLHRSTPLLMEAQDGSADVNRGAFLIELASYIDLS